MIQDVFCKIIAGELGAEKLYEDEHCLVVRDIHPQAPVHFLVIPRKHIEKLSDADIDDELLLGHLLRTAEIVAAQEGLEKGYRVIINEGEHGGKLVPHLHVHVLGGKALGPKVVQ